MNVSPTSAHKIAKSDRTVPILAIMGSIALPEAHPIDDVDRLISIIADAFSETPLTNCFLVEADSVPPPYPAPTLDKERRRRYFTSGITTLVNDGAIAIQTGDYSAVAIWEPAGFEGTPFTTLGGPVGPIRTEWRARVAAAKKEHLQGRKFWHLGFIARNPAKESVKGAITALVKPFLERAKAEGVPVWLESVDERATAIYAHYGFKLVEHIRLREGTHNKAGWPEEGGEGVSGYCMICEP